MRPVAVYWRQYQKSEAAALLDEAARQHCLGNSFAASLAIAKADLSPIRVWTEDIWGKHQQAILRWRAIEGAPRAVVEAERSLPRMPPPPMKRMLVARDGHYCRFCGIPLIRREVRLALRAAYPTALRWGKRNSEQHAAFQCMWLQYDHVIPHKRGGTTSLDNLLVTCAPCNFGRMNSTVEEVGLIDPRARVPLRGSWDGLERVLGARRRHSRPTSDSVATGSSGRA